MMWLLYQAGLCLLLLIASPFLLFGRRGHYLQTLRSRMGRAAALDSVAEAPIWLHAVSVGEVGVAASLIRSLPAETPLLVTTITPTGQQEARRQLADRSTITYFPFDLDFAIRPFLDSVGPSALVLVEGDLWPLVLNRVKKRRTPIIVVNGRVSDRNYRRLQKLRPLLGPLFGPVDFFAVQGAQDRHRLLTLDVPESKIEVTGNLKFDSLPPTRLPELEQEIRRLSAGRWILIAGSTMATEEAIVLDAFARLGGSQRALLLLAPRHPERFAAVGELLQSRNLAHLRRSAFSGSASSAGAEPPSVVLLDSLGELSSLYAIADAAFIGGTLVDTGGHNPLEPARFGTPIAIGPSMQNFSDIERLFDEAEAWTRVTDAASLAECWQGWIDDPQAASRCGQRAERLAEQHRGALEKTLAVLERHLPALRS